MSTPFPLSEITLHLGSQFDKAFSLNKQYMQSIDPDRMLHTFRINAGLNSTAEPFSGSWEESNVRSERTIYGALPEWGCQACELHR